MEWKISCMSGAMLSAGIVLLSPVAASAGGSNQPFFPPLIVSSTIPMNGDLNPYGIAFVPDGFPRGGAISPGDVLVSNFNASNNLQGTGTTIVKLTPNGVVVPSVSGGSNGNAVTFFQSPQAGLTTALGVLRGGFVIVGNVPTTDGTRNTISTGTLQVIDRTGKLVEKLTDLNFFDSPWDLTINDQGSQAQIFVSNVLSGTVSRLDVAVTTTNVKVEHKTMIAMGYTHRFNQAALVLGPTGLAFDPSSNTLYVASTADNAIFAVPDAGTATFPVTKGTPVFSDPHLRGPLGLAFAPNGHLITTNGDAVRGNPAHPSGIVEFTKTGTLIADSNIDAGQGAAFGLATILSGSRPFNFAAVNDATNAVWVFALPQD
jgi:DNA-binding beta-propeller fold protein YncE